MSTTAILGNQVITEPGAYFQTKSKIQNTPRTGNIGSITILDTNSAATWASGGVAGVAAADKSAIKRFNDITDFKNFVRGGIWYDAAESLFFPNGFGTPGVKQIIWLSARSTTAPTITHTLTNGTIVLKFPEGVGNNGTLTSSNLSKGYGSKITAGKLDTAKYIMSIYVGTYRGLHTDGTDFDGISAASAVPRLISESPEVSTVAELISWIQSDSNLFDEGVRLQSSSGALTNIVVGDITASTVLAVGGTETYSASHIDQALEALAEEDFEFFVCDRFGSEATHVNNVKIQAHISGTEVKYLKQMFVAGGSTASDFSTVSIAAATTYNSQQVIVIHGGIYENLSFSNAQRQHTAFKKMCKVVGRTCGLAPQDPLTFKLINIDGEVHELSPKQRKLALSKGVLHTRYDEHLNGFVVNQGINTLQANTQLVNANSSSHLISVVRIFSNLGKIISINSKIDLLGDQTLGPNYTTLSEIDVLTWTKAQLQRLEGSLIKSWRNVAAVTSQDSIEISFYIVPNFEINKLLFTSYIVNK